MHCSSKQIVLSGKEDGIGYMGGVQVLCESPEDLGIMSKAGVGSPVMVTVVVIVIVTVGTGSCWMTSLRGPFVPWSSVTVWGIDMSTSIALPLFVGIGSVTIELVIEGSLERGEEEE